MCDASLELNTHLVQGEAEVDAVFFPGYVTTCGGSHNVVYGGGERDTNVRVLTAVHSFVLCAPIYLYRLNDTVFILVNTSALFIM